MKIPTHKKNQRDFSRSKKHHLYPSESKSRIGHLTQQEHADRNTIIIAVAIIIIIIMHDYCYAELHRHRQHCVKQLNNI